MKSPISLPLNPRITAILQFPPVTALIGLVLAAVCIAALVALLYGAGVAALRVGINPELPPEAMELGEFAQILATGLSAVVGIAGLAVSAWILAMVLQLFGMSALKMLRVIPDDDDVIAKK